MGVRETVCTCRSVKITDACSDMAVWMGVWESGCTCRSGDTADACGQMVTGWGVRETVCTCRLVETADACGGEVVDADELGRWLVLVSWRGGEMPMRGVM